LPGAPGDPRGANSGCFGGGSNDRANHCIALLAFANFVDDPEKETRTGMHHSAFEYASFDELNASYLRLKDADVTPAFCLDHGMTLSY
jgi:catechol 2,3-dioxygenase